MRVVEAQHVVGTRRLVDSALEQELLEEMIERVKPRAPDDGRRPRLHYLLAAPFRYPPLRHGSRFGTRGERGIFYGSLGTQAAMAEVAYYRLVFLEGTSADLPPLHVSLTSFRVPLRSSSAVDLTKPPFAAHEEQIASPVSYLESQALGAEMRAAGIEIFVYRSARDREGGQNVGVFSPGAIAAVRPRRLETWLCVATRETVEIARKDFFRDEVFAFPREDFLVAGELPAPAL